MCECTRYFKHQPKKFVVRIYNHSDFIRYEKIFKDLGMSITELNSDLYYIIWDVSNPKTIMKVTKWQDCLDKYPDFREQCVDHVWYDEIWYDNFKKLRINETLDMIAEFFELTVSTEKYSCQSCLFCHIPELENFNKLKYAKM